MCQEVAGYLAREYPGRFALYEHTAVRKVVLRDTHAVIDTGKHAIKSPKVVLCTNGFESFSIINENGLEVDGRFHSNVRGYISYMSGYLEDMNKLPTAISYFNRVTSETLEPYFYLTRRPYEYEGQMGRNLISVGGPEGAGLEDTRSYAREQELPDEKVREIDAFLRATYDLDPNKKIDYVFTWHGLMGLAPKTACAWWGRSPRTRCCSTTWAATASAFCPRPWAGA